MLCKVCGAQIPDDAQECEFCGTKVNEDASAAEETKVINTDEIENAYQEHQAELNENLGDEQNDNSEEQENSEGDEIYDDNERRRREQVKKMMEDKKQQLSEIERRRNEKRKRQRRNRIVLIGAICALAVAAAGIGVYYLVSNVNGGNKIEETPAPSVAVVSTPSVIATPAVSEEPVHLSCQWKHLREMKTVHHQTANRGLQQVIQAAVHQPQGAEVHRQAAQHLRVILQTAHQVHHLKEKVQAVHHQVHQVQAVQAHRQIHHLRKTAEFHLQTFLHS